MGQTAELRRMAVRTEQDRYGPGFSRSSRRRALLTALMDGSSSLVDVWPAFDRKVWRSHPERDAVMLALDTNVALSAFFDRHSKLLVDELEDNPVKGGLSQRERELLGLLARGMSNVEVARRLRINEDMVRSHLRHLLTKIEESGRVEQTPQQEPLFDPTSLER